VTSDKLILGEEAVIRRLLLCEVSAEREKCLEAISNDFQAR
jgi:hypothetical protein